MGIYVYVYVMYLAQYFDGCGHLLLADLLVLLFLGGCLESLPRQTAPVEVHEHVSEGFHVVAAGLLDTEMCIYRGIPSRTGQVLVLSVQDVLSCTGVAEFLR